MKWRKSMWTYPKSEKIQTCYYCGKIISPKKFLFCNRYCEKQFVFSHKKNHSIFYQLKKVFGGAINGKTQENKRFQAKRFQRPSETSS
jgi:hypothetical protein